MAEARAACHPVPAIGLHSFRVDPSLHSTQVAVSNDGFVLYIPHPRFIWKSLKRAVHSTRTQVQTLLWPLRPRFVVTFISGFVAYVCLRPRDHWLRSGRVAELIWKFDSCLPGTHYIPNSLRVAYLSLNTAITVILVTVFSQKSFLRWLLSYHGWLFEGRTKSGFTKFWGACLKYGYLNRGLLAGKPLLYSFQHALPSLKPPRVEDTVSRWLETVRPVMNDEKYQQAEEEANQFLKSGVASQLQSFLWRKSLISRNYVTDWWIQFVYLRGRSPLFINSNFYGIGDGADEEIPTSKQLPRAAVLVYHWLLARQLIDRERLPPLCINDLVPLCMDQYRRAFNASRIPGRDADRIRSWDMDESRHLVVIYKGIYYTMSPYTQDTGRLLQPTELLRLLQGIVDAHVPSETVTRIGALTTMDRTKWATVREEFLVDGRLHNRQTLDQIERAMFIVNLDDDEPEDLTTTSNLLFCGDGTNRWCDKSFSFVIFKNGRVGIHTEHTWADAPVIAHLFEWILAMEQRNKDIMYTKDGDLCENIEPKGAVKWSDIAWQTREEGAVGSSSSPRPLRMTQRLHWRIPKALEQEIDSAVEGAHSAMKDLDLEVSMHDAYGKGLVKKAGVSPDGWIQMALQLAYYRDQGKFELTYESSMTRLYHDGRTETIRSCSEQSCEFVLALEKGELPKSDVLALLRKAGEHHVLNSRKAMVGQGVDRHLFALYVVSAGKGIDAPFLQSVISSPWKLSTSQVPQRQLPRGTWPQNDAGDRYYTPSGGFGPVADDGYGISYCLCGDSRFFFHVSSKKTFPTTDSARMQKQIHRALKDMASLVEDN